MPSAILNHLQELQKPSGKYLGQLAKSLIQDHDPPLALVKPVLIRNGKYMMKPLNGAASLAHPQNRQSVRKVKTLDNSFVINELNTALLGGKSYPVLTAVLGAAAGLASTGAGLLFAAATTGLSLSQTSRRVLARDRDEIWHVEEIGKAGNVATHVSSFILVDPYRKQTPKKGWLIHEQRKEVLLS